MEQVSNASMLGKKSGNNATQRFSLPSTEWFLAVLSGTFFCHGCTNYSHHTSREQYLQASTYLSSRAFPSTVLSATPSLVATPASYPILIPGVDALNHARAHPVSWVVSQSPSSKDLAISLVLYTPTPAGGELFNNYGPKPNSELILAYGFSLHNNPDDTIVLSVGGVPGTSSGVKKKWEVGRNAKGIEGLWEHILEAVAQAPTDDAEGDDAKSFEDQLDAAGMLSQMCQASLDRLPAVNGSPEIRPHVRAMLEDYLEGIFRLKV